MITAASAAAIIAASDTMLALKAKHKTVYLAAGSVSAALSANSEQCDHAHIDLGASLTDGVPH